MNVSFEKPPIYDEAVKLFKLTPEQGTIFTYGDTVYNPWKIEIPDHLQVHEEVHMVQQGKDPARWWKKYFADTDFRLSQELEAYRKQYKFACKHIKDRNAQSRFLWDLAEMLASPMYGNLISFQEALGKIRKV